MHIKIIPDALVYVVMLVRGAKIPVLTVPSWLSSVRSSLFHPDLSVSLHNPNAVPSFFSSHFPLSSQALLLLSHIFPVPLRSSFFCSLCQQDGE